MVSTGSVPRVDGAASQPPVGGASSVLAKQLWREERRERAVRLGCVLRRLDRLACTASPEHAGQSVAWPLTGTPPSRAPQAASGHVHLE